MDDEIKKFLDARLTDRETKNLFRWVLLCASIFTSIMWTINPLFSGNDYVGNWPHCGCSPSSGCMGVIFPNEFNWRLKLCFMFPAFFGIAVFYILQEKKDYGQKF